MNLFLDLDGVFADFEGGYLQRFGHACDSVPDDEMWKNINSCIDEFFINLPVLPGSLGFYRELVFREYSPIFLTACSNSNYATVAKQKKEWVRKNVDNQATVLPVNLGKYKHLFLQNAGDILVDDFSRNIERWEEAGGTGLLHTGQADFAKHLKRIKLCFG